MGQLANINRSRDLYPILTQSEFISGIWYDFERDTIALHSDNKKAALSIIQYAEEHGYSLIISMGEYDGFDNKEQNHFQLWR